MWLTRLNIADSVCFGTQASGDLGDSKSTSGGVLCFFGSRPFVALSCMCKKQTSVYHSFWESEIIFLSAGLRMDGLLALHLCDMVIEVLRSTKNTARQGRLAQGDLRGTADHSISKNKNRTPTEKWKREVDKLSNVVYVHTNNHSSKASLLYIFWRQSGCHQDDDERNESNTETRVQNPHSCAWLVVRQNKLGPKDPNQICWHQKSTCWHANQRVSRVTSATIFVCTT